MASGDTIKFEITKNYSETIKCVKEFVCKKKGFLFEESWLSFGGKCVDDEQTLLYYSIGNGSTLHLTILCFGRMHYLW